MSASRPPFLMALAQAWAQTRSQWQSNVRLRGLAWCVLALLLLQVVLLAQDHADESRKALQVLRTEHQRLRAVPSATAWGQRAEDAAQVLAAYEGMAWAEPDLGLSEAAVQDGLRTLCARLGLPLRELSVGRVQSLGEGRTVSLPPGHQLLRARLVVELKRSAVMALLAELSRGERALVVERLVWRAAGQPATVELELRALARSPGLVPATEATP